jgi:acetyl esterase/lipase
MSPEIPAKLQALGVELSPSMLAGTTTLLATLAAPPDPRIEITRDHFYGPDARNRLDVFRKGKPSRAPVLVYVHGGGFVMGDKTREGSPFYDNVGQWAAQQGFVGVTMTYRLAPASRWPCGPEDMSLAVAWLRAHSAEFGGNPDAIFLLGQSAGAAHVAAYVCQQRFHPQGSVGIAGALMISGIYDAVTQPPNQFSAAYYGEDHALCAEARHVAGLVESPLPMLFSVSELDPPDFSGQAAQLSQAWHERHGRMPPMEFLFGHNHLSPAQCIGSTMDDLGPRIARFIAAFSPT